MRVATSVTTVDLYPYLIIIGGSILIASARMLFHYRKQSLRGQELIRLNEKLEYDLPDFLRLCWPILLDGRFVGMSWELDWFGTKLSNTEGEEKGNIIENRFEVQEIYVDVRLYHEQKGWDQQHFTETLAENFFLLVRMNMWIKLGSTERAFDQAARVNVFLQHDVKNMIQLLGLMSDHCNNSEQGKERELVQSLQQTIPAVRDRAKHMLSELTDASSSSKEPEQEIPVIQLDEVFAETALIYNLRLSIRGKAEVTARKESLQSIIDNLLGNYSYQDRKDDQNNVELKVNFKIKKNQVITTIHDVNGAPCLWPERLFEPFWSELGMGRGIGLYQAKHLAESAGGTLSVTSGTNEPLKFLLSLPNKADGM